MQVQAATIQCDTLPEAGQKRRKDTCRGRLQFHRYNHPAGVMVTRGGGLGWEAELKGAENGVAGPGGSPEQPRRPHVGGRLQMGWKKKDECHDASHSASMLAILVNERNLCGTLPPQPIQPNPTPSTTIQTVRRGAFIGTRMQFLVYCRKGVMID